MLNALRTYVLHGLHTPRAGTGGYQSKTDEMNCASSPQILLHPQKKNSRKRSKKRDARQTKRPSIDPSIMKSESEANHESRAPTQIHALVCNFREKKKKTRGRFFLMQKSHKEALKHAHPTKCPESPTKKHTPRNNPTRRVGRGEGVQHVHGCSPGRYLLPAAQKKLEKRKEKNKVAGADKGLARHDPPAKDSGLNPHCERDIYSGLIVGHVTRGI